MCATQQAPAAPTAQEFGFPESGVPTQINVVWNDNSDNEQGFLLQRSTDGVNYTDRATIAANETSYVDTVTAATNYWYRIRAFNNGGFSAWADLGGPWQGG